MLNWGELCIYRVPQQHLDVTDGLKENRGNADIPVVKRDCLSYIVVGGFKERLESRGRNPAINLFLRN